MMSEEKEYVTITARVPKTLRDKLEEYRRKNGFRSLNEALIHILKHL